jgi:rsbT antagonist protein RsbS
MSTDRVSTPPRAAVEVPILQIEGILVVSIQSELSDTDAETLQQRLLETVTETRGRGVLIEVSGLDIVDSYFCRVLRDTAAMCRLMGATTVITGLRPAVAVTLTELGLDLPDIHTDLSLERGLAWLRADPGRA